MSKNLPKNELTICTVSFKQKYLIEENIRLTERMNPSISVNWVIVENTPDGVGGGFDIGEAGNLKVVKGMPNNFKGIATASYHHASGLNRAIGEVNTRYALVLDPDFYLVRKNWINDVIGEMKARDLAVFGVPYNPKRYMKYRDFPCIHCMFIDLTKFEKSKIDFSPQYNQGVLLENRERAQAGKTSKARGFFNFIYNLKHHLRIMLKRGAVIGSSRDTGYKFYDDFRHNKKLKSECAVPVFKTSESEMKPSYLKSFWNRAIEIFLPDNICYLPKTAGYYSEMGFKELGFPDVFSEGWDEFLWKGEPFGFHMQGAKKDGTLVDRSGDVPRLREIFDIFMSGKKNKTVFISVFEGVESKNILRTGIVDKILEKDHGVNVVLFTKNKERAEYYEKEFSNFRISYEVAEPHFVGKMDGIFSKLKFYFLQTETTDLRAKLVAEDRGELSYYFSICMHWVLARPFFIRIFRFLDKSLVKDNYFDKYFEKYNPDLIFLANLFEDFEANFLQSAKRRGIRSIGLINSWDRVTARCVLRVIPDKIIVFNDMLKIDMARINDVSLENIIVSGLPQYDNYFLPPSVSREEFFDKLGLKKEDKLVIYSPIGGMFSNSDWEIMDMIHELDVENRFGDKVKILVRFPPNDFIKDEELKKRPYLLYQYPGTRFSTTRSTDWDMNKRELEELRNTLYYMSLIVCYGSSISVDAAVFDKPIININFEIKHNNKLSKSPTTFYQMYHYKKAIETGGIKMVNNKEELVEWVKKYLENPSLDKEGRQKLVEEQCQFKDGKSAERIAEFVLNNIK